MPHVTQTTLLFITLVQLCRTEISNSSPEPWYSANVINDGSYLQTQALARVFPNDRFSTANPIVVASSDGSNDNEWNSPNSDRQEQINRRPVDLTSASIGTGSPGPQQQNIAWPTTPGAPILFLDSQTRPNVSQWPPLPGQFDGGSLVAVTPSPQPPQQSSSRSPPILVYYQQPQQNFDNISGKLPPTPLQSSIPPSSVTITSTGSTYAPHNIPSNFPTTTTTRPPKVKSSTIPSFTTKDGLTSTPLSIPPHKGTKYLPKLQIKVVAPKGGITNVKINPSTTTKAPTTTRRRKSKKNNSKSDFDICVNSCRGKKQICTTPLGVSPIDPDQLKGFPSICHMACHNSFQKIRYQKISEGRCGRLRTRIHPVNSRDKIKRDELNKSQYTLVHTGSQTVFELGNIKP